MIPSPVEMLRAVVLCFAAFGFFVGCVVAIADCFGFFDLSRSPLERDLGPPWDHRRGEWTPEEGIERHSPDNCPACRRRRLQRERRKLMIRLVLGALFAGLVVGFLFWMVSTGHAAPHPADDPPVPCCCHPSPDGRGGKCTPCAYSCRFPHFGTASSWDVPARPSAPSAKPRRPASSSAKPVTFDRYFAWWLAALDPFSVPGARDQTWPPPRTCCRDEMGSCQPCAFPFLVLP